MICKKHQINMRELNGRLICPMCEKGIPGDVIFFEKSRQYNSTIEKHRRVAASDVKKTNANGSDKETGNSGGDR